MIDLRSHSLCALLTCCGLLLIGCGDNTEYQEFSKQDQQPADPDAHAHHHHHHDSEHEAPHGGTLVELGDHAFHAEIVFDEKTHSILIYLLDGEAKGRVGIDAKELMLKIGEGDKVESHALKAQPQETDGEGKASRFASSDEALFERFHDNKSLAGQIDVPLDGKSFPVVVAHDHDHDHDDHDKKKGHDQRDKKEHATDEAKKQ